MAGSRRIYIHIGLEKTGTTSLQLFLAKNRLGLASNGIAYPGGERDSFFGYNAHGPVAAALAHSHDFVPVRKLGQLDRVLGDLERKLEAEPNDVVLSAEHLSSRLKDVAQIEALKAALGDRDATIVCYIRRQDSIALSAYSTAVKVGERRPFDQAEVNAANPYFNHLQTLTRWAEVFGDKAMVVREYSRSALRGGDIRDDFASVVGISSVVGWHVQRDRNASLDALQMELLRRINRVLPRHGEVPHWAYVSINRMRRCCILPLLPGGRPIEWLMREASSDQIMGRFAESNAEIERRFMHPGALTGWLN